MVSKRTRVFGLINIFLFSSALFLAIIATVLLIIAINNDNVKRGLSQLNSEVGLMGVFFFVMMIISIMVLLILIAIFTAYVVLNIRYFYKKLNKNIISYNFFCANLIVSIIFTLNVVKVTFSSLISISNDNPNLLLPLGSLIVLFAPVSGILYSIFGMIDYKRSVRNKHVMM